MKMHIDRYDGSDTHKLVYVHHQVTVETLAGAGRHGFLINVFSDKSCPGLLVSILEAFDELGLSVLQATASCADTFRLEAVGGEVINNHACIYSIHTHAGAPSV